MGAMVAVIGAVVVVGLIFCRRGRTGGRDKSFRMRRLRELALVAERSAELGDRQKAELYAEATFDFCRESTQWAEAQIRDQGQRTEFLAALESTFSEIKTKLDALGLDEATILKNRPPETELDRLLRGNPPK